MVVVASLAVQVKVPGIGWCQWVQLLGEGLLLQPRPLGSLLCLYLVIL